MTGYEAILHKTPLRWDHATLSYSVAPEVAAWRPFIEQALGQWDKASGLSFVGVAGGAIDGADIRFTSLAAVNAPKGALGWTVLWTDDATDAIGDGFVGLPADPAATDPLFTALHEIGHAIGLAHPGGTYRSDALHQDKTVMAYPDGIHGGAASLREWDVAAAQFLYGPDGLLLGGAAPDRLIGGGGRDSLDGGDADDRLGGGGDADTLRGGAGADAAYGNLDADLVYGNGGADSLWGGQGADSLFGGQGADRLAGGLGDDRLTGGAGADRFLLQAGGGTDRITDFDAAQGDRLQAAPGLDWVLSDGQDGAVLTFGEGCTLVLQGVRGADVAADWFVAA